MAIFPAYLRDQHVEKEYRLRHEVSVVTESVAADSFLIGLGPFRIDRVGEGRTGAGNIGSHGGRRRSRSDNARCDEFMKGFQRPLLPKVRG